MGAIGNATGYLAALTTQRANPDWLVQTPPPDHPTRYSPPDSGTVDAHLEAAGQPQGDRDTAQDKALAPPPVAPITQIPSRYTDPSMDTSMPSPTGIQTPPQLPPRPLARRGVVGRLEGAALGGLQGLATGSILKAGIGAVEGAADPQRPVDIKYYNQTLPRAEHDIEFQGKQAQEAAQTQATQAMAQYHGELAKAIPQQTQARVNTSQAALNRAQVALQGLGQKDAASQRSALTAMYKAGAFDGDPDSLDWAANALGIDAKLRPAFHAGQLKDQIDANGNLIVFNKQTGQVSQPTDATGAPVTQPTLAGKKAQDTENDRAASRKIAQQNADANTARANKPTEKKSQADIDNGIMNEWSKTGKTPGGNPIVNGKVLDKGYQPSAAEQKEIDKASRGSKTLGVAGDPQKAEQMRLQFAAQHGHDLLNDPEFKQERTRRMSGSSGAAKDPRIGKTFTVKGTSRKVRVVDINPDGSPKTEDVP